MAGASPAFARGSFGDLVAKLQRGLGRLGHYTRAVDGDFGGGTQAAVRSLQADNGLPITGRADREAWLEATDIPWPSLFERCLQLTARFEQHGYRLIAGNFDGAGLTWGIVGFTLKHGELRAIVNELAVRAPESLRTFGDNADELAQIFRTQTHAELMAWADSISTGAHNQSVIEPWRSGFAARLGARDGLTSPAVQRARSVSIAWTRASALVSGGHSAAPERAVGESRELFSSRAYCLTAKLRRYWRTERALWKRSARQPSCVRGFKTGWSVTAPRP